MCSLCLCARTHPPQRRLPATGEAKQRQGHPCPRLGRDSGGGGVQGNGIQEISVGARCERDEGDPDGIPCGEDWGFGGACVEAPIGGAIRVGFGKEGDVIRRAVDAVRAQIRDREAHGLDRQTAPVRQLEGQLLPRCNAGDILIKGLLHVRIDLRKLVALKSGNAVEGGAPNLDFLVGSRGLPTGNLGLIQDRISILGKGGRFKAGVHQQVGVQGGNKAHEGKRNTCSDPGSSVSLAK